MSRFALAGVVLLGLNLWGFALFWYDKRQARDGGWRISESSLLLLAAVGGWPGALLGRKRFRHKTRKQPFAALLLLISGLEAAAVTGWLWLDRPLPASLIRLSELV